MARDAAVVASGLVVVFTPLSVWANILALQFAVVHLAQQLVNAFNKLPVVSKPGLAELRLAFEQKLKHRRIRRNMLKCRESLGVDRQEIRQLLVGGLFVVTHRLIREATSSRWPGRGRSSPPSRRGWPPRTDGCSSRD